MTFDWLKVAACGRVPQTQYLISSPSTLALTFFLLEVIMTKSALVQDHDSELSIESIFYVCIILFGFLH